MKKSDFQEILKKCFGKQKDEKYHAVAMLAIYGIFVFIVVLMVRIGGSATSHLQDDNLTPSNTPVPSSTLEMNPSQTTNENSMNYSYSYTITYNGDTTVLLGKKVNNKEKFTLIQDGTTTDYAILSDNYLILENGFYHITENPNRFLKYCDIKNILLLVENEIPTEGNDRIKYSVSNQSLATFFKETISTNYEQTNSIQLQMSNDTIKSADIDFSNYFSVIEGVSSTLTIHMDFVDIGTTEDFEIPIS